MPVSEKSQGSEVQGTEAGGRPVGAGQPPGREEEALASERAGVVHDTPRRIWRALK